MGLGFSCHMQASTFAHLCQSHQKPARLVQRPARFRYGVDTSALSSKSKHLTLGVGYSSYRHCSFRVWSRKLQGHHQKSDKVVTILSSIIQAAASSFCSANRSIGFFWRLVIVAHQPWSNAQPPCGPVIYTASDNPIVPFLPFGRPIRCARLGECGCRGINPSSPRSCRGRPATDKELHSSSSPLYSTLSQGRYRLLNLLANNLSRWHPLDSIAWALQVSNARLTFLQAACRNSFTMACCHGAVSSSLGSPIVEQRLAEVLAKPPLMLLMRQAAIVQDHRAILASTWRCTSTERPGQTASYMLWRMLQLFAYFRHIWRRLIYCRLNPWSWG